MTVAFIRNVFCLAGLITGVALITGADAARAQIRDCTQEEIEALDAANEALPTICEVMTVSANRPARNETFTVKMDFSAVLALADLNAETAARIRGQNWSFDTAS